MKYYILCLCFFIIASKSFSQNKTKEVEQYCIVDCLHSIGRKGITVSIDYGNRYPNAFGLFELRDSTKKLIQFKSDADALNYMGKQGWELINAYPSDKNTKYIFKKKFLKSDIKEE